MKREVWLQAELPVQTMALVRCPHDASDERVLASIQASLDQEERLFVCWFFEDVDKEEERLAPELLWPHVYDIEAQYLAESDNHGNDDYIDFDFATDASIVKEVWLDGLLRLTGTTFVDVPDSWTDDQVAYAVEANIKGDGGWQFLDLDIFDKDRVVPNYLLQFIRRATPFVISDDEYGNDICFRITEKGDWVDVRGKSNNSSRDRLTD